MNGSLSSTRSSFPVTVEATRRLGIVFFLLGFAIFLTGIWGLWHDVAWIAQPFYAYGWWGYIFMLDGLVAIKRSSSLFTCRRKHVFPIALWSISFWFFFELLNLRYQNWYYVGVFNVDTPQGMAVSGLFVLLCFSTVFIGIFQTYEAITAFKFFKGWKGAPRKYPAWVSYAVQLLGVIMVTLSLVFPHYLAPLVWGSFTFIVDPWNYRRGARSILRDLEKGDYGLFARIFIVGFICGLVWESLNFFAPQKWIYTVRGLENFKLFEMPLLGFFGFPALAFDAFAAYAFLSYWFLGNETWENIENLPYKLKPRPHPSRKVFMILLPFHFLFWVCVLYFLMQVNLGSVELELEDLRTLRSNQGREVLRQAGIKRPIQLLRALDESETRYLELQSRLRYSAEEMQRLLDEVELFTFKGIGLNHGILLQRSGISRVEDLEDKDPELLQMKLMKLAEEVGLRHPRLGMVRVWVFASRSRGVLLQVK